MTLCAPLTQGWGVRCRIPLEDLGNVRMPRTRMRYQGGWVRLGIDRAANQLIATLEDREGTALPKPDRMAAISESQQMGRAVCEHLMAFNKQYEIGMATT